MTDNYNVVKADRVMSVASIQRIQERRYTVIHVSTAFPTGKTIVEMSNALPLPFNDGLVLSIMTLAAAFRRQRQLATCLRVLEHAPFLFAEPRLKHGRTLLCVEALRYLVVRFLGPKIR